MISHGALGSYVEAAIEAYRVGPFDRVLQFSSLSFDASAEEIYPCLATGALLVLRDEEMVGSARRFWEVCRERAVTLLCMATAYWHELAAGWNAQALAPPPSLRRVVVGGERLLPARLADWLALVAGEEGGRDGPARGPALMNSYGPTEATVVVTVHEVLPERRAGSRGAPDPAAAAAGRASSIPPGETPIGRPIGRARAVLVDRAHRPVPLGVAGELVLGGDTLARGYLGHPARTAVRFVPDPLGAEPGARLYRTGDRARRLPGGELDFLGRLDHQIKIRGFRVEPGEVEAVLGRHPEVAEAAVVAVASGGDGRHLAAYVVPRRERGPAPGEETAWLDGLRRYLAAELPPFMVPAGLAALDALPLSALGKVDRAALPPLPGAGPGPSHAFAAPRHPLEATLAAIWQRVLGVPRVGRDDNFFDLGGHSLLLVRVNAELARCLTAETSILDLFRFPTVRALAAHLARGRRPRPAAPPRPRPTRERREAGELGHRPRRRRSTAGRADG
jgi:acyl-coenzyme A synthetase/AMP-(fatty) acid ligase